MRALLYLLLAGVGGVFVRVWFADESAEEAPCVPSRSPMLVAAGFVTNFFDTLGIGSFAPTTSIFKLFALVPDRLIPGTLLVGHTVPTLLQAFIYITIIEVDIVSLVLLIAAAVLGSWLGAGAVAGWPKERVRIGMGIALLVAAAIFLATALGALPAGGGSLGLSGWKLAVGLLGNFAFGALMTIGIGAYAPSLILFGLLGMNLKSVFPVMMGSCAFLMPIGGIRFIQRGSYSPRAALGLTVGGAPGVLLAAFLVREMSIDAIRWLVIVVALYTASTMLRRQEPD